MKERHWAIPLHSRLRILPLVISAIVVASPGAAQLGDLRQKIFSSLVYIEVSGQKDNGVDINSAGTGFFVSNDGQILTSYHLLNSVMEQKPKPDSIKIMISVGFKKQSPTIPVNLLDAKQNFDLMLLKMPERPGQPPLPFLKVGSALSAPLSLTTVRTAGFPESVNDYFAPEQITSRNGPGGFTWLIQGNVERGQSGSPIFLDDGTVIGVMKGEAGASHRGAFVPIDQAESLLLPMRFRELREQLHALGQIVAEDKLHGEIKKYISGTDGTNTLTGWLSHYLTNEGQQVIDDQSERFITKNTPRLDNVIDSYMKHLIAYSQSAQFSFNYNSGAKTYKMPFYKSNQNSGELNCTAEFSNNIDLAQVNFHINDGPKRGFFGLAKIGGKKTNKAPLYVWLPEENENLFDTSRTTDNVDSFQSVRFWVDDTVKFEGTISVACTILIIGRAKFAGPSR